MAAINSLYLLTDMTGRASGSERTMIVATLEMKMRTFWIGLAAAVPGLILTALFYPLVGIWALTWLVLTEAAAFFLIEKRTADGLRLRTYQTLLDKKRSNKDTFYLCGQPVDVGSTEFGKIQQITAPVHREKQDVNVLDLFNNENDEAKAR